MAALKKANAKSVKFHSGIYREAAVRAAARDYASFAVFAISKEGVYIKAVITPKAAATPERLEEEFINRALINSI